MQDEWFFFCHVPLVKHIETSTSGNGFFSVHKAANSGVKMATKIKLYQYDETESKINIVFGKMCLLMPQIDSVLLI